MALLTSLAGACVSSEEFPTKPLIPPSPAAEQAAIEFHRDFPDSRIVFSQNSGEILLVDGRGQSLAPGNPSTPEGALATVVSFVEAHPALYRVSEPDRQLQLAEAFRGRDKVFEKNPSTGVTALRFWYVPGQYPSPNRYGIAFFKADGSLAALVTEFHSEPVDTGSGSGTGVSQQPLTVRLPDPQPGWRRFHDPELNRVVDVRVVREQFRTIRILKDPQTGQEIQRIDETGGALIAAPQGWQASGTLIATDAPDTQRATHTILSTALASPASGLVLGFGIPGVQDPGKAVTVGDALFGEAVPLQPIATDRSSWMDEPALGAEDARFPGATLRDATRLAEHLEAVMSWYSDQLGWRSWDGRGGSFHAGVRGNRGSDGGARAYGGNGFLLVNAGHTSAGVPISHALDIVAHEFSHSVVTATADFSGSGEAGALNESLADVLGTVVKGYSKGTILGEAAGEPLRDVARPSNLGDPESYGEYRLIEDDGGGIHTNCGVMNRALSLAILGQQGRAAIGELPLARLLLESMRYSSLSPVTTLEGFAAALSASCRLSGRGFCDRLDAAFGDTELLNLDSAVQ